MCGQSPSVKVLLISYRGEMTVEINISIHMRHMTSSLCCHTIAFWWLDVIFHHGDLGVIPGYSA